MRFFLRQIFPMMATLNNIDSGEQMIDKISHQKHEYKFSEAQEKKIDAENELEYWARSTKRVTVEQLTEDISVSYLRRVSHI